MRRAQSRRRRKEGCREGFAIHVFRRFDDENVHHLGGGFGGGVDGAGTRKLAPSPIFAPNAVHNARVSVASAVADAILAARANVLASSTPIGARAEAAIASTTHKIAAAAATTRAPRVLFSTPGNSGSASNAAAIHGEEDEPPRTSESDAASAPRPAPRR